MTNEATTDDPNWDGHKNSCIGGNKGPCNCGATDEQRALDALDELYGQALEFHSLGTTVLYETVRAALTRDNSDALRVAKEALEAGVYALAYVEDNGKGDGITLAAEGLMREAITKLNAAMGG